MTIDVLLTGFEPFDGADVNESWEAVRRAVPLLERTGLTVRSTLLPVEFGRAGDLLDDAVREHLPRLVVATGLAGGRTAITPERVAVNVQDARIPDNAGHSPVDRPCIAQGPAGLFTMLPIKAITEAIREQARVPAAVSQTAGTFVCNDVFYRLMHLLTTDPTLGRAGVRGGFVHVPSADAVDADGAARAVATAARVALDTPHDLAVSGGSEF